MKKLLLLSMLFTLLGSSAWAQTKTVTGKVTSAADGAPLPGVTVVERGTTNGVTTDASGNFSLTVQPNATLMFSFIGMTAKEVAVGNQDVINVTLAADARQISEVVITGYTTQNRREVTGSVGTVKAEEVALAPIASFDQSLQGRSPGILVQANSGQPGAAANVLIRGRSSILGGNQPLYILDGIQISATDFSSLNPTDFASINILKDASATSIYGSRGSNGVVVITSKKGLTGPPRIDYNFQYGFSKAPENKLKLMNSSQKLDYEIARGNPYDWTDEDLQRLRAINTDWADVFFQTGTTQNHTLSASGGAGQTTYFLSGSVFDQTGTVRNTGIERYTGRANLESVAGNFTFGLNSTFGYSDFSNTSENNTSIAAPLNAILWTNPYETPRDEEGNYTEIISGQPNALQELLENSNRRQQLKGVGNVYVSYAVPFVSGLTVRTNWGGDFTSNEFTRFNDPTTVTGNAQTGNSGSFSRGYNREFQYTGTTSLAYNTQFGADHTLSAAVFNEIINNKFRGFNFVGYGLGGPFQNEAGITPGNATNGFIPAVGGTGTENALLSYFVNVNYGFKDRYFLTLGARRDGSSRFGEDRRFANFGSVGLSWIVSDESFMEGLTNIFNQLKYKISYGSSGNQVLLDPVTLLPRDFASRELFGRSVYGGISGLAQTQLANPQLQWERNTIFNTGIELSTLGGRLRSTVEYYDARTTDLFLDRQLSRTSGYAELISNIGELQNRGVEFSLDGDIIATGNFTWSANINLTRNQNRIVSLVGDQEEIISGTYINRVGESMNSIYVVRFAGVNPANGNALYLNQAGEETETFSADDRVIVGSTEIPFFGGFGTSLNFKGFEVSTFFSFVKGNSIYNNDLNNVTNPAYYWDNMSVELLNEWQKAGDITNVPRPGNPFRSGTTRFVEDGNFVRLRNVNVSYALPQSLVSAVKLRALRVFTQGQNLVTWTDYRGFDPESAGGALSGAQYPALRTVTFGLSVGL
jgi:TonB-linked SusC/RagA family outer membrane protein